MKSKPEEEVGYVKSLLLTPVRAVREQLQVVVDHGERAKHSVQDQYHEFQDKTGCKCMFWLLNAIFIGIFVVAKVRLVKRKQCEGQAKVY